MRTYSMLLVLNEMFRTEENKMHEEKIRARIKILRARLEQEKEREDYGKAAFISGQIFERELILEDMLSWDSISTDPHRINKGETNG